MKLHILPTNQLFQDVQQRLKNMNKFEASVSVLELSNMGGLVGNRKVI